MQLIILFIYLHFMNIENNTSEFNKTLAPWIGKTFKMINMYIWDVLKANNIHVTKEQWIVLKILQENNEGLIQNDLAFITYRNKASLTRLINVMEKNGLVSRCKTENDARKKTISITQKGTELFLKIKPLMLESIALFQKDITKKEKEMVIQVLKKIQYNINNNQTT